MPPAISTTIPMHTGAVQAECIRGGVVATERGCVQTCHCAFPIGQAGKQAGRQATGITYLLHGHGQSPQRFPRSVKFFSASFMSLLIWSIPSSMRSSCSELNISQLWPPRNKECGKANGDREKEKAERRKKGDKKKKKDLKHSRDNIQSDSSTRVKPIGASPVPTCRRDIQVHSICLHLLNFSLPPSCLCWYGSCHLQHARVALVRTKGLHSNEMRFCILADKGWWQQVIWALQKRLYVNVKHLWRDGLFRFG